MTIAQRIAALLGSMIVGLLLIGGVSLYKLQAVSSNLHEIAENVIPSVRLLASANEAFLRARPPMMNTLLVSAPEAKAGFEKHFLERLAQGKQSLAQYASLVADDKDKALLDKGLKLFDEFQAAGLRVIALSKEGKEHEAEVELGKIRPTIDALANHLDEHMQYNYQLADIQKTQADASADSARNTVIITLVVVIATCLTLGMLIYRHVTGSLNNMAATFVGVATELDFTRRQNAKGNDEIARASNAFDQLLGRLQASFREINEHTGAVSSAASRVATASGQMSIASGQQSEASSSMAASVEEMTVSINHVADRAKDTNALAAASGDLAHQGEGIIGATVDNINSIAATVRNASGQIAALEHLSERINNVVSVIKDVADQTNLLALNAAIEAARAGDQGRGFAVVADEVRKLAERTTQSTQEIADTITEMQASAQAAVHGIHAVETQVNEGVQQAQGASQAIAEIGAGSGQTVEMVRDISDAIHEQSQASTDIAQQVERIAQMSEENSAAAQATAETATELAGLAETMQQVVARYKI